MKFKDRDGNIRSRVDYNDHTIKRITLTLHDHGSLHDKRFAISFLESATKTTHEATDSADSTHWRGIKDLNNQINKYIKYRDLINLEGDYFEKPSTSFYCFEQLQVILSDVDGPNDFEKNMDTLRHVITSNRDFYKDYKLIKELRKKN